MSTYEITIARERDLIAIAGIELAAATLLSGHAPETVLNETTPEQELLDARREGRLWVALANDVPVGFALVKLLDIDRAHLEEIAVHPDHGRRGLGRRLVATVCEWAAKRGLSAVTLTTFRRVPFNMPFYQRLGFEEIPGNNLDPVLESILRDEALRGLDPVARVAMRCCLRRDPADDRDSCPETEH